MSRTPKPSPAVPQFSPTNRFLRQPEAAAYCNYKLSTFRRDYRGKVVGGAVTQYATDHLDAWMLSMVTVARRSA